MVKKLEHNELVAIICGTLQLAGWASVCWYFIAQGPGLVPVTQAIHDLRFSIGLVSISVGFIMMLLATRSTSARRRKPLFD